MRILALDPGLTNPAVAVIVDGELEFAERVSVPKKVRKLEILARCDALAELIVARGAPMHINGPAWTTPPDVLVVEWPQWYGDNQKGIDPNDLAGLCGIAGAVLGRLRVLYPYRPIIARSPVPRDVWGALPKATKGDPWASPRGQRLVDRLSPAERARVQSKHDALDAAGLALWAAGRWKSRRLYPGAVE